MAFETALCELKHILILSLVNMHFFFGITEGSDTCHRNYLKFKPVIEGRSLTNHVIKTHSTETIDECELKCYLEDGCMSINYGPSLRQEKYVCELSDSHNEIHPEDLQPRTGFLYRPTENFCVNNRCSSNSRCQTGFTDRGYRCVCSAGFTGEYCEIAEQPNSCKQILESGTSVEDGEYEIKPVNGGEPLRVYCDMTTDGGGWFLIANFVIDGSAAPPHWGPENSYRGISNYQNNRMVLKKGAMNELSVHLPFTQLRFHCRKQQGRTFHVTTVLNSTGEAVVRYFSDQTDVMPASCGSFVRMSDDNSHLAAKCEQWGYDGSRHVGKWGKDHVNGVRRMYNNPVYIEDEHQWHLVSKQRLCDDSTTHLIQISPSDFWKIYAR